MTRIPHYRTKRGLTQTRLADEIGITKSYLSKIEQGKRVPTWPVLCAISERLQIAPQKLMEKEELSNEDVS